MADQIWTNGAGTRVLNTAGNWSGGATPGANDAAMFLSDYTSASSGPNSSMATLTAIDLDDLYIGDGYTESIGATANHLDISSDRVMHHGTGTLWYKDGAVTTDYCVVDMTGGSPSDSSTQLQVGGASAITLLSILRGRAVIEASATVTEFALGRKDSPNNDSRLQIDASATVATGRLWGGIGSSNSALTTLEVFQGTWTQSTGAITTLYVYGGRVNLNVSTTYTTIHHYDGIVDFTRAGGIKTVTNYYIHTAKAMSQIIGYESAILVPTNKFVGV